AGERRRLPLRRGREPGDGSTNRRALGEGGGVGDQGRLAGKGLTRACRRAFGWLDLGRQLRLEYRDARQRYLEGKLGARRFGDRGVWLTYRGQNTISRIDPATNKVGATIHVGSQPVGVAVSPGAVCVVNAGGPSVSRIDPVTNRVVATIRVGPKLACCSEHFSLTAARGAVWVGVPNENRIVRIDATTNRVTSTMKLPYPPCAFLAADTAALWST